MYELRLISSIVDLIELYGNANRVIAQAKESYRVETDDNIIDPLTKPLSQWKHDRHITLFGIR